MVHIKNSLNTKQKIIMYYKLKLLKKKKQKDFFKSLECNYIKELGIIFTPQEFILLLLCCFFHLQKFFLKIISNNQITCMM